MEDRLGKSLKSKIKVFSLDLKQINTLKVEEKKKSMKNKLRIMLSKDKDLFEEKVLLSLQPDEVLIFRYFGCLSHLEGRKQQF